MNKLRILIPADFSEQTMFALQYAKNFRPHFEVEVLVLHVLELSAFAEVNSEGHFEDFMGINTEMLDVQQSTARENMAALYDRERSEFRRLKTYLKLGPLTDTIVSFAKKEKVDMILMGTKGADNLKAWFSGTETQVVCRYSEIPVLSVMCDRSGEKINHLLFISDFNDIEVAPDPVIRKLADAFESTLHLLCIARPGRSDTTMMYQRMEEYAREHHLQNFEIHLHADKSVPEGVEHFNRLDEMDFIAIGTHGRKGIRHLLRESIAEKLITHLHKPVLVYKI